LRLLVRLIELLDSLLQVWCIEHAEAGEEIVECIAESLSILETPPAKKVARLFLISDILHNCCVKGVPNVSFYRKGFQSRLLDIFEDVRAYHDSIESRMKAEAFKQRVMGCFRAWEDWTIYPQDYLIRLQNVFLGLERRASPSSPRSEEGERAASAAVVVVDTHFWTTMLTDPYVNDKEARTCRRAGG